MNTRLAAGCTSGVAGVIALVLAMLFASSNVAADSAVAVSAGGFHTCALTPDGAVKCWGQNNAGQLGDGTTTNSSTPVDVVGLGSGVSGISAGGNHTCALLTGGAVKCWGSNGNGQLGNGSLASSSVPVDVTGLAAGVAQVSAGGFHTCAVLSSDGVKCWGKNNAGQLGDGSITDRTSPVDVAGLTGAAGVSAGGSDIAGGHTCAWTSAGAAKCWGRNDFGQLGDGSVVSSTLPVDVSGLGSSVTLDSSGRYHTCALLSGGSAKCWGWNIGGQVGDGTNVTRLVPADVSGMASGASALDIGGMHGCAIQAGAVKCWGVNTSGELGNGVNNSASTMPVDVLSAVNGPPLSGAIAVSAGGSINTTGHTCAILSSGAIKCWGKNGSGQLGDGTLVDRTIPVDVVGFEGEPPTATPTDTPLPTDTPVPTDTATPTDTPMPTDTATPTNTSTPTLEEKPTATAKAPSIAEQVTELRKSAADLGLPPRTEQSLGQKLDTALRLAERGKPCAAANTLGAFANELRALVRSRRLSADAAAGLIKMADQIAKELCP